MSRPGFVVRCNENSMQGGVMLTTKKTLKVEKGEMENKICGKMVLVAQNGLKM